MRRVDFDIRVSHETVVTAGHVEFLLHWAVRLQRNPQVDSAQLLHDVRRFWRELQMH